MQPDASPAAVPDVTALAQRIRLYIEAGHWGKKASEEMARDLAALLALVEQTRQERDLKERQLDRHVELLEREEQRSWTAERERDEAEARERELREALVAAAKPLEALRLVNETEKRAMAPSMRVAVIEATDAIRAALAVAGRPPADREEDS